MPSDAILQWGSEQPVVQPMQLRAGPLTMSFEPANAFLRYVRLGQREVVRGIYVAVRNHNWDTVTPTVTNFDAQISERSFLLSFDVECRQAGVDFFWCGKISGAEDGTVTFSMRGEARTSFRRNRIGFCVLHPMSECAGQPCIVEHTNGTEEQGTFPDAVSPHQPFFDIRAITHEVIPGLQAEVRCEGDAFEMEDQRNWTDASYKTYCTPLGLPFPVEVVAGTIIEQSVTVQLFGNSDVSHESAVNEHIVITIDETRAQPLPAIGLSMASHEAQLSADEVDRLRALLPAHLRVDLHLSGDYLTRWQRAVAEASRLGTALEVVLFVTDNAQAELAHLVEAVGELPPIARWLVFHENEKSTSRRWIELARQSLRPLLAAPLGAGSDAYFTEVNRGRPPLDALDFVCFSLNPQVHAFDNASLVETLEAQATVVKSTARFADNKPVVVTPVTLQPRFNPNATGPEPEPTVGELPSQVDVRQMSLFGAAWTLGSLKYLAQSGASSVTFYETTGWRGVMETAGGSPIPEKFPSIAGAVFPLYHVLADVAEFTGGKVLESWSNTPLQVECLALRKNNRCCLLLGNFSHLPQQVQLQGIAGKARCKLLDISNVVEAMRMPEAYGQQVGVEINGVLELTPYSVARVDFVDYQNS
jgi:hypothetical protein